MAGQRWGIVWALDWVQETGIPYTAGYPGEIQFADDHPAMVAMPPDLLPGTETVLRVLELTWPKGVSKKSLAFSTSDLNAIVGRLQAPGEGSRVISRDFRIVKGNPQKIWITLGLSTRGGNPDAAMRERVKELLAPRPNPHWDGFGMRRLPPIITTHSDYEMEISGYGVPASLVPAAHTCCVVTRATAEDVRQAFCDRGVPATVIVKVTTPPNSRKGGGRSNVVMVYLDQRYPVAGIPWKVALVEPAFGPGPRTVTLRGRYCKCCRSTDHQCKQCVCWREPQCGRCGLLWKALTAEGRSHHLHDCEGGPTGFGPEHIDPLGSAWADAQRAARAELVPAPAEDPAAQNRSASLAAARDYARRHKGNIAKRGRSSSATSTPPSQHQKDDSNITPLIV